MAKVAGVKLLVFYHLLPSADGFLPRRLAQGVNEARKEIGPSQTTAA
jgi:hypothetical protein